MAVLEIIDADGRNVRDSLWFADDADLGPEALTIVSVLGAQASGKSTLLNSLFGTDFAVGSRAAVASSTTKGITAAKDVSQPLLVALDVEGADSRDRGASGRSFQSRCASFSTAISDVILLNLWYHDVGRFDAAGYALLDAVFTEAVKIADGDSASFKTALVFVVRDAEDDVDKDQLTSLLMADALELFDADAARKKDPSSLQDLFDVSVVTLPHMRYRESEFKTGVSALADRVKNPSATAYLGRTEFSKSIPADGVATFSKSLWESLYSTSSRAIPSILDPGSADSSENVVVAFKCNEAFSDALQAASTALTEIHGTADEGEKIEAFGTKATEIMTQALASYDAATEEYSEEGIWARKRRELEGIIDTQQHAVFMKQLQVLRENALAHFKSATASDEMPSDFAFYTADALFQREAEESKREGSSWSTNQERTDLQNMMQEISTQRKRLLTSQVTAAQQQAHAMQYLQMQQSQMNAMQAQAYGGSAGQWNVGAAYRPPDTNINASLSYQQGRTNIQISMVPDESASLLGPNGFTAGVGPGNLGLSFNIGL